MIKNLKTNGKAVSIPAGLALGGFVSTSITLIGCLILANSVKTGLLKPENIGYGMLIQLLTASFMGAMTAHASIKHRKKMVCILSGVIYYMILIIITALFFGGQYQGFGVTGLVVLAGALTTCLTPSRSNPIRHKTKKHHRVRVS